MRTLPFAAALLGATLLLTGTGARADTADATCEMRKDGNTQQGKSGPCTFGQRQGYITVDLRNGDTVSLSPAGGANQFRDDSGNKVTRTLSSSRTQEFKWQGGKKLTVTFQGSGGEGGGYSAPATGASGMSAQRENAEWQRGFNDGLEGRYDQNNHPQPYKDGVAAGEDAARQNRSGGGGGGGGGGNQDFVTNDLDDGAFEVAFKGGQCYVNFNANGRRTSASDGCGQHQIEQAEKYARYRTR